MGSTGVRTLLHGSSRHLLKCSAQERNPSFVLRAIGQASIEEKPIPQLKDPWDVRIHIAQTGICGSDLHFYDDGHIGGRFGRIRT